MEPIVTEEFIFRYTVTFILFSSSTLKLARILCVLERTRELAMNQLEAICSDLLVY